MDPKEKKTILIIGAVILAAGVVYYFYDKNKNEIQEPLEEIPINPVLPSSQLNRDKVLKKGQTSPEVKELQRLLNVKPMSGFFGDITLNSLIKTKGLNEISLNQFSQTSNVTVMTSNGLKIGDFVEVKSLYAKGYKNIVRNNVNISTGEVEDTYLPFEDLGKIITFSSDKNAVLIIFNR